MSRILQVVFLITAIAVAACSGTTTTPPKLDSVSDVFLSEGITATLVVATADGKGAYRHNVDRSTERFSPASTFKIPNTLIALDAGVVVSRESAFVWDGKDRGVPAWNADQTLGSAFRVSCVWCYQEIARKIGIARYAAALDRLSYGNQVVGSDVDRFWLNGDLQISATEQVEFLRKLFQFELPYRRDDVRILKDIMRVEKKPEYTIYAKTGWAESVAWYVGFVEAGEKTWFFAMNMQVDKGEQAARRVELTMSALRELGII